MVNDYKTIDIIDSGVSEEYLVNRIDKLLGGNGCEENYIQCYVYIFSKYKC